MASERLPTFHPHPSTPKLQLPPGSWDTHCHVLGPTDKYPFAATTTINPADAPKEMLFALHAMLGIERCVIVQTATHGIPPANSVQTSPAKLAARAVASKREPGLVLPSCMITTPNPVLASGGGPTSTSSRTLPSVRFPARCPERSTRVSPS